VKVYSENEKYKTKLVSCIMQIELLMIDI